MEYTVLREARLDNLIIAVNRHIKDGWRLQGGIAVHGSDSYTHFFQAMVRG